jgi:hypothetical protein
MTLDKLVDTVQGIQITMAKEQAVNQTERDTSTRVLQDHELRIRRLEDRNAKVQ